MDNVETILLNVTKHVTTDHGFSLFEGTEVFYPHRTYAFMGEDGAVMVDCLLDILQTGHDIIVEVPLMFVIAEMRTVEAPSLN